jgi:hypothetical protein
MNDMAADKGRLKAELEAALFGDAFVTAYAVVDGAQCLELMPVFEDMRPPNECLFMGELDPEVEMVAPYLVELREDSKFFDWLFDNGWGKSWAIYMTSESEMLDMRAHFRRLTVVEMPDGQFVYFRFYDPRVLRSFLPTCDQEQTAQMYGKPIETYFVEGEDGAEVISFRRTAPALT